MGKTNKRRNKKKTAWRAAQDAKPDNIARVAVEMMRPLKKVIKRK